MNISMFFLYILIFFVNNITGDIMEDKYRRFLVSYSYSIYNQSYHCIANDEIVLKKKKK